MEVMGRKDRGSWSADPRTSFLGIILMGYWMLGKGGCCLMKHNPRKRRGSAGDRALLTLLSSVSKLSSFNGETLL